MSAAAAIHGRKGGEKKPHTPKEAPDSAQSIAYAKVLVALGEGEFAGNAAGTLDGRDIYLDGTPLIGPDGAENFPGVRWEFRPGTPHQEHIAGLPAVENEIGVGVELRSGNDWVRAITNPQLSAVRLRLSWPRLQQQKDNGDVVGCRIDYAIDLATDGGSWQLVSTYTINDKVSTKYERTHRIDLPAGSAWQVRVRRLTPNQTAAQIVDQMRIEAITEVIDAKLRYPNTALLYVEFDASQFQNIPPIAVETRGRVIRVPSNYDPATRTYAGLWDGTFKWAWTDNPAWVWYDVVLAKRFGLGRRITADQVDKWALYRIAQYCDELVPDGQGGQEPRFTCNVYIQSQAEAWTVLRDLAAIFRGMTYWDGTQMVAEADMPRPVDYVYSRANGVVGGFSYAGGQQKNRYSMALVSFDEPANAYQSDVEPVSDNALVRRYGVNKQDITAIGCTRRSEANRRGRWLLLTNAADRMVTFRVGLDGVLARPGWVIGVADELLAGRPLGGRISLVSGRQITLDRDAQVQVGDRLVLNLPSGVAEGRTVQSVTGRTVTVTTEYSETPRAQSVWALDAADLAIQLYRVTRVSRPEAGVFEIVGVQYDPSKHGAVDTGARIEQRPVSVVPAGVQAPPTGVTLESFSYVDQGLAITTLRAQWEAAPGAVAYEAEWRKDDGQWLAVPRTSALGFEVPGIYAGRYLVRVRAVNPIGVASLAAYSAETQFNGKEGAPPALASLTTMPELFGIGLAWAFPAEGAADTQRTEIEYNTSPSAQGVMHLGDYAYPHNRHTMAGLAAGATFHFRGRLVDRSGNVGPWSAWVMGQASANATKVLDAIGGQITETHLGQHLAERIDLIDGPATVPGTVAARVATLRESVESDLAAINAEVDSLAQQVAETVDALAYEPARTYAQGDTVRQGQRLYQAAQAVPINTAPPNATYWLDIGQVVQSANALAAQVQQNSASITQQGNTLTSQGQSITSLTNSVTTADGKAVAAQQAAQDAATLAGSKGKVIVQSPAPAAADRLAQNLWIDTTNNANTPKRWNGSAWAAVTDKVATDAAAAAANALSGLATKADATALQALDTRVTSSENTLTSQGQSITSLTNTVGTKTRTYRQATAPTTGLTVGDLWVNTTAGQNNKLSRWNGTGWDDTTDPRIPAAATAEALNSLGNTVTQQGNTLTSQGQSITSLTNRVTSTENVNTAQAGAITSLDTRVTSTEGALSSQASRIDGISAQINPPLAGDMGWNAGATSVLAGVWSEQSARASEDMALGQRIDTVVAQVGQNAAAITAEQTARATADSALASRVDTLSAKVDGDIAAALQSEATARANADGALSSRIDTAQAKADSASASVQTVSQAQATTDGKLQAMYSVKLGVTAAGKYYGAGMGIGIENTPEGMQSQVLFQADRFAVINVANGQITTPFVIQGGQVFINSAVIGDGTIDMAKIATALQSTNYVAGQQGWRLDKSGTFEINGAVAGGARLELRPGLIRMWYPNGALLMRMGSW
ncbi:DUF1983 domain-containing protein [Stutzerimonas stutzeri]|nr:DUF1983 domain-containing protein [Stutzerimonas stutzeri]